MLHFWIKQDLKGGSVFIFIAMCFPAVPYYFDLVFDIIELLSIELVAPIPWHLNPIKKTGVVEKPYHLA
jgi:hypothetical protein